MGTFNRLVIPYPCSNCKQVYEHEIQFRFGTVWQYDYVAGDKIKRDNAYYDIGKPDLPKVRASVYLVNEFCPLCGYELPCEWDVIIQYDHITGIEPAKDMARYTEGEGADYYIDE